MPVSSVMSSATPMVRSVQLTAATTTITVPTATVTSTTGSDSSKGKQHPYDDAALNAVMTIYCAASLSSTVCSNQGNVTAVAT